MTRDEFMQAVLGDSLRRDDTRRSPTEAFDDHDFEPFARRAYVPICFPDLIAEAVRQYVGHGHPMGGYLTALFAGDVFRSVCNADAGNFAGFALQCKWIAQCCPTGAFGSYENVEKWIEAGGLAGLEPDWKPQREEG